MQCFLGILLRNWITSRPEVNAWLSLDSELVINCNDKIRRMNVVRSPLKFKDWRFISWESKGTLPMPIGDHLRGNDC